MSEATSRTPEKVSCPGCCRQLTLTKEGRVPRHKRLRDSRSKGRSEACNGSGLFPIWDPPTQFTGPKRLALLERIAALATELCISVDRAEEDVGGSRPALVILQEIGPLTDELEHFNEARQVLHGRK